MSELTAYLICRLDAIGVFVVFFICIIPLILGIAMLIVGATDDTLTENNKKTLKIAGIWLLVFGLFGAMLKTCIPSTKEMIMIKLAPKITNIENLQLLKANIIEITKEINSALK
jgi:hypothetical protein